MIASTIIALLSFASSINAAYNCYTTVGNSTTPSTALYSGIGGQCNSYQYTCNQLYNATCSPTEILSSAVKWDFTFTSNGGCSAMYLDPTFSNVCCCSTDLCNSPANVYGCSAAGVVNTAPVGTNTSSNGTTAKTGNASTNAGLVNGSINYALIAVVVAMIVL